MFDEDIPLEERVKRAAEFGDYTCVECGEQRPRITYYDVQKQIDRRLCFTCNFWTEKLGELHEEAHGAALGRPRIGPSAIFIINGTWYQDSGARHDRDGSLRMHGADREILGFAGRIFKITRADGTTCETNNLWCGGPVPAHFRARMPDNASFQEDRGVWVDLPYLGKVLT